MNVKEGIKPPKNGKERKTPIPNELYYQIKKFFPSQGDLIFSLNHKYPVNPKYITGRLNDVMKAENITGKSFHSFRHTFNTKLVASGLSGEIIRSIIGHVDEKMTDNYLHLKEEELVDISKSLSMIS